MYGVQSVEEESGDEAGGRRRKRRSSHAGVQYSEDLSDAMFNRLMQADQHSDSASEVTCLDDTVCMWCCCQHWGRWIC